MRYAKNIHSNYENKKIYEEKPMGAVSAFTTGNYHCKLSEFAMSPSVFELSIRQKFYC